jgi:hypothetical protein
MNHEQVYQWYQEIHERLPLSKWQAKGLAIFSLGVVCSERSTLSKIAEQMWKFGRAESIERRLRRWIANPRIVLAACCRMWSKWVLDSVLGKGQIILLVDLTKLGDRLDVLMVGLSYRRRCIPLAWRCLPGNQPWPQSQVEIIAELLEWVAWGVPEGMIPLVQADRGIGNSSDLMKVVKRMEWHFLFRVNASSSLRLADGRQVTLSDLIRPGKRWSGTGVLFQNEHAVEQVYVHLLWRSSMPEAWCLVTNAADVTHAPYAQRIWQEEGFRDLKSGGWQWQRSQVRHLAHAQRLILALALAYAWTLSLGTQAIRAGTALRRQLVSGRRRRLSVFRLGLRYLYHLSRIQQPPLMALFFRPALT